MSKTNIEEINRNIYDIKNKDEYEFKIKKGLTPEIIEEISKQKNDPNWMKEFRLKALEVYNKLELPTWGPDLSELNMDEIATYVRPKSKLNNSWEDVPEDIKNTFDKLGIQDAEKESLAGVGAQYDSEVVYHSMKQELIKQGVIYTDMESAIKKYPDLVKAHFMKCVPVHDHKFVALHGAVWSGGSFVYVPKNVNVDDNAYLRYSTIENWSKNMLNLNTKKAICGKNAQIDWVSGSFGSKISMLYPMSILNGEGAKTEFTGISFAGAGQALDNGFKVVHNAPNTSSVVNAKSISKNGGKCTYRSLVRINESAKGSKSSVSCESLMLDDKSISDTIPTSDIRTDDVEFSHEAKIGKISDKTIFYLMSRGLFRPPRQGVFPRLKGLSGLHCKNKIYY